MLIRIINTLRSRIWDMVLFLFSSTRNLQISILEAASRNIELSIVVCCCSVWTTPVTHNFIGAVIATYFSAVSADKTLLCSTVRAAWVFFVCVKASGKVDFIEAFFFCCFFFLFKGPCTNPVIISFFNSNSVKLILCTFCQNYACLFLHCTVSPSW